MDRTTFVLTFSPAKEPEPAHPEVRAIKNLRTEKRIFCEPRRVKRAAMLVLMSLSLLTIHAEESNFVQFASSFISGYTFNPEGRYTREYHPYILGKTQASLAQLENKLAQNFHVDHRILVMGYEHNAIPRYFDCLSHPAIADEAVTKTDCGWEFAAANLFGLLTGYLFKDAGNESNNLVQHVKADDVELFAPNTGILRKHAFGQWTDFIEGYQTGMQSHLRTHDIGTVYRYLEHFWQSLYEAESKNSQAKTIATQDILFSLYYIKHLAKSAVVAKNLFVGPDLTYPIEVSPSQPIEVTRNAQAFVARFAQELTPINNEKTAYVFWSFVDGVGKSTLLGNITNWQKYGKDFASYEHVSNTSSQKATLYPYTDNIVIADLPAQVSHYCAKPEGSVYIDLGFCPELEKRERLTITRHVHTHAAELTQEFKNNVKDVSALKEKTDIESMVTYQATQCTKSPRWCPFVYRDKHFVFNTNDPRQIRILVPFDHAHSQGLKIKEPELMIFDAGLAIPMKYEYFMDDLTKQLADKGVKHIVLVDFLGMYPRTSRETVRINYFVQQLKEFYGNEFDLPHSAYHSFSHPHELYPLFADYKDILEKNLFLETLLRWVVFDTLSHACTNDIQHLESAAVRAQLRAAINDMYTNHKAELDAITTKARARIEQEIPLISYYQYSIFYESVAQFSVERFAQLAEMVRSLTAQYHPQDEIRELWTQLASPIDHFVDGGRACVLENGLKLSVVRQLRQYDVDQSLVTTLSEQARNMWYEHIIGLIVPELQESYKEALLVKKDKTDTHYMLLYQSEEISDQAPTLLPELELFGITTDEETPSLARQWVEHIIRTQYQQQYLQDAHVLFVPLERFYSELEHNNLWNSWLNEARQMKLPQPVQINYDAVQAVVLACATLHMNLKSPHDKLMMRYGNQEDFIAGLRIWHDIMLSKYLNISLHQQLFADYAQVQPLVGILKTTRTE